jgi:hypothetical protein
VTRVRFNPAAQAELAFAHHRRKPGYWRAR